MILKILGLFIFWVLSFFSIINIFLKTINQPNTLVNILGAIITMCLIVGVVKLNIKILKKFKKDVKNV